MKGKSDKFRITDKEYQSKEERREVETSQNKTEYRNEETGSDPFQRLLEVKNKKKK